MYFIVFLISYVFLCFSALNFLIFGGKLLLVILQSQIHQNEIDLTRVSVNNIIYVIFLEKMQFTLDLYTKSRFLANFGPTDFFQMGVASNHARERGEFGLKSCVIS